MEKTTLQPSSIEHPDAEYIQGKMKLIEQGLPLDISETELESLETMLRDARGFYIDILGDLRREAESGEQNLEKHIIDESINIANIELALRRIDEFRAKHWPQIQNGD